MNFLKDHKWAIFLALVTAVIVAYPQIYFRHDIKESYSGIELIGVSDDESAWMSRIREVQDGHYLFANAYFKEGKNDPYMVQPLGTIMVASLGKIFALDINDTLLLSRLFFTFLVFLIIYFFIFFFAKEKLLALAATTGFILAKELFSRAGLAKLIFLGSPRYNYTNLMRPVNPALTYFFFFGFLLFFWLFFEKKQWRWGILSIIFLGLSFYDYFYTWTILYAFLGFLAVIFFFQRKWDEVKKIALVVLGSLFIASLWFVNFFRILTHPNYAEVHQRYGLLPGHLPTLSILAPLLFAAVLFIFPRGNIKRWFFAIALAASPFIVLNQQVVTGFRLSADHYHWYFTSTLFVIFLFLIFFLRLPKEKLRFLKKSLLVAIILFSIYNGVLVQSTSYAFNKEGSIERQRYGPLTEWLNQNAAPEDVIFATDKVSQFIVIYTPLNVFYHLSSMYTLAATKERLLNAVFAFFRLNGVSAENADTFFLINKRDISARVYGQYYRDITGDYSGIPDEIIKQFSNQYKESLAVPTAEWLNSLWTKYQIKYVVWDKSENPKWELEKLPFLKTVANIGDFVVYQKD